MTRNLYGCNPYEDGERMSACSNFVHSSAESFFEGSNFLVA